MTAPTLAEAILDAVRHYHDRGRWHCRLFMLMPDHAHALLAFPGEQRMSETVRQWKSFLARVHGLRWQDGYFDHRVRNAAELELKAGYIRRNPVVKGLCADAADWPWVLDGRRLGE